MNWAVIIAQLLQLTPIVVAGIESIHQDASGETKQQMAVQALQLATGTANAVVPADEQPAAQAAEKLAAGVIPNVVEFFNATGIFQHKASQKPAPKPVNVPTPAPVQQTQPIAPTAQANAPAAAQSRSLVEGK